MKHTSKNYIVGHGITLLFVVAVIVCVSTHMDPTEDGGRISTRFNNNRAFANLYNTEFHQNDSASTHVISSDGLQQLDPTSGGGINSNQHQTNRERRRLENGDELVTVDVSFESILKTVIFLMTSWIFAVFSQMIGLPILVGEITTGFILGPPLLDFVAYPEAMVLIGSFGLIGLLLDSGINLDIAQLRETGSRAVMMAVTGTILALGVGLGMGYMADSDQDFRASFAIGAAFAPSSFGVASQVLKQGEVLNTPMGQVIVAASVVDDILGLILLSIMEVLVKDSPTVFDYIKPFLASFGYLFVLGYAGIKIIPNIVENKILPRFSEDKRDLIAFSMLFILMAAYLPIMFYSGASYLTGAFLAGLSFSQIHSVHTSYLSSGPHLKVWLMRIFFAATIGFQVPIRSFSDSDVLNWGFFYCKYRRKYQNVGSSTRLFPPITHSYFSIVIPILAKLPLGCMVPRLHSDLPDDFPYNPYHRDVLVTTLAMLCRGEFNFIIASFALNAGVIHPDQYAAIVFSILLSAIFAPLALTKILKYYNEKFKVLLQGKHKIERIGDTTDGSRPLFLAIQARTPITWGIQDKFVHALEKAGVSIVDHRTWHTLGLDAVDITEIFCQDSKQRVRLRNAFANSYSQRTPTKGSSKGSSHEDEEVEKIQGFPMIKESPSREALAVMEDKQEMEEDAAEIMAIEARKEEIRQGTISTPLYFVTYVPARPSHICSQKLVSMHSTRGLFWKC